MLQFIESHEASTEAKKIRALVNPIAKKYATRLHVRKGTGSMRGTITIQNGVYPHPPIPAFLAEVGQALIDGGYESNAAMWSPSTTLAKHAVEFANVHGHSRVFISVVKKVL